MKSSFIINLLLKDRENAKEKSYLTLRTMASTQGKERWGLLADIMCGITFRGNQKVMFCCSRNRYKYYNKTMMLPMIPRVI